MSRVVTSIIRIASISRARNVQLAIAAQIFLASGTLILFIINIVFAMRIVRSTHRSFGWHPAFGIAFKVLFAVIAATLLIVIVAMVQSSYTLDAQIRALDRSLQHYGSTLLAIVATLPLPIVILTLFIPYSPLDEFGTGRMRTKVIALLVSTILLSIGAWYRCGIAWQTPVPRTQPLPSYLGKGPFYILNFLFEFQTVMMYAILRIDQRYHIPNGAKGPGSYSKPARVNEVELRDSRPTSADETSSKASTQIHDEMNSKSMAESDVEKAWPLPIIPQPTRQSRPISSRPQSQRQSLLQQVLTHVPTATQKRQWRASEESRVIRRLGGPWSQLPSPTESTFSDIDTSPTKSMFSEQTGISAGTGLSVVVPPSIRSTLHEDWRPDIDWELGSPRRFLSFKKKSMVISP